MDRAQQFTSGLPLGSNEETTRILTECHAFEEPDEARLRLPSSLSRLLPLGASS